MPRTREYWGKRRTRLDAKSIEQQWVGSTRKTNSKLKKQLLSINLIIESFFNNFKNLRNLKEIKNKKNYKTYQIIFICTFLTIILILSYFLTPSFYNKNKVAISLQNQLLIR